MNRREYERMTEKQLKGRRVRALVPLKNRIESLPAGTLFTITGKFGGLALKSDPCEKCGMQMWITRVGPGEVELIPLDIPRPRTLGPCGQPKIGRPG